MAEGAEVLIVGAGLSGLAAAARLARAGRDVLVVESSPTVGGHTRTIERDGFRFDEGPHVLFAKDQEVSSLLLDAVDAPVQQAEVLNYYAGFWVPHPAQCHLNGLPVETVVDVIAGFTRRDISGPIETYEDWCRAHLGDPFFERFTAQYTRKYWTVEASEMSVDWVGQRVYPPSIEELLTGALVPDLRSATHYITEFAYPAGGGYQAFIGALEGEYNVMVGTTVAQINPSARQAVTDAGDVLSYGQIISTMPLPVLVHSIPDVPESVLDAAARLRCTSVALVDIALARRPDLSAHWFYVYDEDVSFARGSLPHMMSPTMAPSGRGSIQTETYFSVDRPLTFQMDELPNRVVDDLIRMGVVKSADVLWAEARVISHANVLFDLHRSASLDQICRWVESVGVHLAGRYGRWEYLWTDGAIRSGWDAAATIIGTT